MTIKVVITADDIKSSLGLLNHTEVDEALAKVLTTVHVHLQSVYDSQFEKNENRADLFYLSKDAFPRLDGDLFRLRLRQAFVWSGTVSLVYASTRAGLATGETIPTTDYQVDYEKGIVYLDVGGYDQSWVKVTYSAGFDVTHKAPDWLKEAAMAMVPGFIGANSINGQSVEILDKASKNSITTAGSIIEPYMRGKVFQTRPIL